MLQKLICLIWGHKTICKAYTGETIEQTNLAGFHFTTSLYRWEKQPFCTRCGKLIQEVNPCKQK